MGVLFRTLFIWLLVVAVPAQGAAAAAMAFCGPSHHGGTASAQTLKAAPGHGHTVGVAVAAHQHANTQTVAHAHAHARTVAQADDHAAAVTGLAVSDMAGHASVHKCSACATCCSLGAILNAVLAVPAPVFAHAVFSTVGPSITAVAAEGPDRPPRYVLA